MLAISGYVDWPAESKDEIRSLLEAIGERTRKDEGCLAYWWAEDLVQAGRFRFFEAWESEAAFQAHRDADYEHEFMENVVSRAIGASASQYALSGVKELQSEAPEAPR